MVFPLIESPLGGILGARTASFFRLDPSGTVPLEPLIDIVPGFSPLRVTFDCVDGETVTHEYGATEHPIQDTLDVTSNIQRKAKSMTINGTLGALPPLMPGIDMITDGPQVPPVPGSFSRLDLMRLRNLSNLADRREPVMVITPRFGLARAAILTIQENWTPAHGESMTATVTVRECRLVSPVTGDLIVPDYPSQAPGNNAAAGGGAGATAGAGETATASTTPGAPPAVGA